MQRIEHCMCACLALGNLQKRKSEILWTWLNVRKQKIEAFILGLCLCEECCLFASVFFILQTWVPLGY